jgi:DNA modification methylase
MTARSAKTRQQTLGDPIKPGLRNVSHARASNERRASQQAIQGEGVVRRNDLLPELTIVQRPLEVLVPPTRRLRKFKLDDIIEAANIIAAKGFLQPIFISRDGRTIIDGELRYEAARWLQLESVPCIMTESLSRVEERAVRIALNRLGQRREWDLDVLKVELGELLIEEEPLELLGFDAIELDQIMTEDTKPEEDEVPEPGDGSIEAVCRPGDLWLLGQHKLVCGDALAQETYDALMGDETCQLLLSDPPYNIAVSKIVSTRHREFAQGSGEMSDDQFSEFLGGFLERAGPYMVDGAIGFVFMDWRQIELLLRTGREYGLELLYLIPWVKTNAGMGSFYRSQHELIAMLKKPGEHKNRIQLGAKGRNRANVWFAPGAGTLGSDARAMLNEHPTSKPVQLLVDAMIDVTDPADIVLDCFAGSGSTLIAAEKAGRRARLIELDRAYCDVILQRWISHGGTEPTLAPTGRPFSQVMTERIGPCQEGDGDCSE